MLKKVLAVSVIALSALSGPAVLAQEYNPEYTDHDVAGHYGLYDEFYVNHADIQVDDYDGTVWVAVSIDTPTCDYEQSLTGSLLVEFTDSYGDTVRFKHFFTDEDQGLYEQHIGSWVSNDVNILADKASAYVSVSGGCEYDDSL